MKRLNKIQIFLNTHFKEEVLDVVEIFGGKHSQAFSYISNGKKYVLRINISDRGFRKDKFAYDNFKNSELYIPEVLEIGSLDSNIYFCISDFIDGESARTQYKKGDFTSISLQFEIIEMIKDIPFSNIATGFGEWEPNGKTSFDLFEDFIRNLYQTKNIHDWEVLKTMPYCEASFIDYLIQKIEKYLPLMSDKRTHVHGDFGNDNFFIKNGKCSGIIDWDKSLIGNHFMDVGRIVLYCPDKIKSSEAAHNFYKDKEYSNYKEKIMFGVYVTMLHNYAIAVKNGMKESCESSRRRIEEIEEVINI